jgi:hypothetical protein
MKDIFDSLMWTPPPPPRQDWTRSCVPLHGRIDPPYPSLVVATLVGSDPTVLYSVSLPPAPPVWPPQSRYYYYCRVEAGRLAQSC